MRNSFPYFFVILLLSLPVYTQNDACIEPRNHEENRIADIQWTADDSSLYVSTLGAIWKLSPGNSLELLHSVCDDRFPGIEVSEGYYAVGSDFLPLVLIYDTETDELIHEVVLNSENTRSIAFDQSGENVALSISNYDETGFFDTDRNIEVRNYRTGEVLAELIENENDANSIFLQFGSRVSFVSDEIILISGVADQDTFNPPQAYVYLWNWQTNAVEHLQIEPNAMVEVVGLSDLVSIGLDGAINTQLRVIDLFGDLLAESSHNYDITVGEYFETRLSSIADPPLLAIENQEGHIWVINLRTEQVVYSRKLDRFATEIALDHAGQQIALGYTDGTIQLWDLESGVMVTIGNVFEQSNS